MTRITQTRIEESAENLNCDLKSQYEAGQQKFWLEERATGNRITPKLAQRDLYYFLYGFAHGRVYDGR